MSILTLASLAYSQNSQFLFDLNGNLFVQTAEIGALPQIVGQPQNRVVVPGEAASFFVVAADTRALTYQWRFNGVDIGGATNDALLLQNVSTNNEGEYRVLLTNSSGSVTSAPAMLWIDSDADGLPDSWELSYFGSLANTGTADFDRDGVSNLAEFLDGTNPTNSVSARYRITLLIDGGSVIKSPDQFSYTNGEAVTLTAIASVLAPFHAWTGDVLTRTNSITLVMTNNKVLFAHFQPMDIVWTNFSSGDWNTAVNWAPNLAPGSNDNVIIASSVTVTLNTPADCADVTLGSPGNSPTLTGSGNLTVRGNLSWLAGTMSGSGRTIIETGATLNAAISGGADLNGRILEIGGAMVWTGAGSVGMNPPAAITNRPSGLFEIRNTVSIVANNGPCRIDNAGTFRKTISTGTATLPVIFNNSGTVELQAGTLRLELGGTQNGSFTVPLGTVLALSGNHNAVGSSSIIGEGQLVISGGTSTLAGLVNLSGSNTFIAGTVNFTGNYICTNNTVTISGGTANFNGTGLVSPAVVNLSSGTLGGNVTVTVLNAMNWTGGTLNDSGRLIIPAGAGLQIASPSGNSMNGHTLENGGTVLWTGGGIIAMNPPAAITNRPGALFEIRNAVPIVANNGLCRIDNAGIFRKAISSGTSTLPVAFNNFGTVDIRSGILAVTGGYVSSPNALLNCALAGMTAGTTYGQLQVGGAVTLNGALSVELISGFLPATDDTFTVLSAGARNGAFAKFYFPSNRVTMSLSNSPNSVVLRVTDVLPIPQPVLLTPQLVGTNALLTWTAISNVTYRLENNVAVGSTNWTAVPGDVTTLSNTANKLDPLTTSNRFYRIRVLP